MRSIADRLKKRGVENSDFADGVQFHISRFESEVQLEGYINFEVKNIRRAMMMLYAVVASVYKKQMEFPAAYINHTL